MKKFAVALIFMAVLILQAFNIQAAEHTLQIRFRIPETRGNIYIPSSGQGGIATSALNNATFAGPLHYYLASYTDNIMKALVYAQTTPISITVNRSGTSQHTLEINQYLDNSIAYLVFTQGNWNRIDQRIYMIEYGIFMSSISPSFAYGLGTLYQATIMLKYARIDILEDLTLQNGYHELEISLVESFYNSNQLLIDVI